MRRANSQRNISHRTYDVSFDRTYQGEMDLPVPNEDSNIIVASRLGPVKRNMRLSARTPRKSTPNLYHNYTNNTDQTLNPDNNTWQDNNWNTHNTSELSEEPVVTEVKLTNFPLTSNLKRSRSESRIDFTSQGYDPLNIVKQGPDKLSAHTYNYHELVPNVLNRLEAKASPRPSNEEIFRKVDEQTGQFIDIPIYRAELANKYPSNLEGVSIGSDRVLRPTQSPARSQTERIVLTPKREYTGGLQIDVVNTETGYNRELTPSRSKTTLYAGKINQNETTTTTTYTTFPDRGLAKPPIPPPKSQYQEVRVEEKPVYVEKPVYIEKLVYKEDTTKIKQLEDRVKELEHERDNLNSVNFKNLTKIRILEANSKDHTEVLNLKERQIKEAANQTQEMRLTMESKITSLITEINILKNGRQDEISQLLREKGSIEDENRRQLSEIRRLSMIVQNLTTESKSKEENLSLESNSLRRRAEQLRAEMKEREDRLVIENRQLSDQLINIRQELRVSSEKLISTQDEIGQYKKMSEEYSNLKEIFEREQFSRANIKADNIKLTQTIQSLENSIRSLESERKQILEELKNAKLSYEEKSLNDKEQHLRELELIRTKVQSIENERDALIQELNQLQQDLRLKDIEINKINHEMDIKIYRVRSELDSELLYYKGKVVGLEKERDDLHFSLERLKDEILIIRENQLALHDEGIISFLSRMEKLIKEHILVIEESRISSMRESKNLEKQQQSNRNDKILEINERLKDALETLKKEQDILRKHIDEQKMNHDNRVAQLTNEHAKEIKEIQEKLKKLNNVETEEAAKVAQLHEKILQLQSSHDSAIKELEYFKNYAKMINNSEHHKPPSSSNKNPHDAADKFFKGSSEDGDEYKTIPNEKKILMDSFDEDLHNLKEEKPPSKSNNIELHFPNLKQDDSFTGFINIREDKNSSFVANSHLHQSDMHEDEPSHIHYQLEPAPKKMAESEDDIGGLGQFSDLPIVTPTRIKTIVPNSVNTGYNTVRSTITPVEPIDSLEMEKLRREMKSLQEENRKIREAQELQAKAYESERKDRIKELELIREITAMKKRSEDPIPNSLGSLPQKPITYPYKIPQLEAIKQQAANDIDSARRNSGLFLAEYLQNLNDGVKKIDDIDEAPPVTTRTEQRRQFQANRRNSGESPQETMGRGSHNSSIISEGQNSSNHSYFGARKPSNSFEDNIEDTAGFGCFEEDRDRKEHDPRLAFESFIPGTNQINNSIPKKSKFGYNLTITPPTETNKDQNNSALRSNCGYELDEKSRDEDQEQFEPEFLNIDRNHAKAIRSTANPVLAQKALMNRNKEDRTLDNAPYNINTIQKPMASAVFGELLLPPKGSKQDSKRMEKSGVFGNQSNLNNKFEKEDFKSQLIESNGPKDKRAAQESAAMSFFQKSIAGFTPIRKLSDSGEPTQRIETAKEKEALAKEERDRLLDLLSQRTKENDQLKKELRERELSSSRKEDINNDIISQLKSKEKERQQLEQKAKEAEDKKNLLSNSVRQLKEEIKKISDENQTLHIELKLKTSGLDDINEQRLNEMEEELRKLKMRAREEDEENIDTLKEVVSVL